MNRVGGSCSNNTMKEVIVVRKASRRVTQTKEKVGVLPSPFNPSHRPPLTTRPAVPATFNLALTCALRPCISLESIGTTTSHCSTAPSRFQCPWPRTPFGTPLTRALRLFISLESIGTTSSYCFTAPARSRAVFPAPLTTNGSAPPSSSTHTMLG